MVNGQQPPDGDTASTDPDQDHWMTKLDDLDSDDRITEQSRQLHSQSAADCRLVFPSSPQVDPSAAVDLDTSTPQLSSELQKVIERGLQETARARIALARFAVHSVPSQNAHQPRLSQRDESSSAQPPASQLLQQAGAMTLTQCSKEDMARLLTEAIAERRAAEHRILSLQTALGLHGNVTTQLGR